MICTFSLWSLHAIVSIIKELAWYEHNIDVFLHAGLNKPGEMGEILTLYWLKSLYLDSKAKFQLASFLYVSRSFLANNLCFMAKLIDKAIVKIHKNV